MIAAVDSQSPLACRSTIMAAGTRSPPPAQGLTCSCIVVLPAPLHVAVSPLMGDRSLAVACRPCSYHTETPCTQGAKVHVLNTLTLGCVGHMWRKGTRWAVSPHGQGWHYTTCHAEDSLHMSMRHARTTGLGNQPKHLQASKVLTEMTPGHGQTPLAESLVLRPSHGDHSSPSVVLPPGVTLPSTGAGSGVGACGTAGDGNATSGGGLGDVACGGGGLGTRAGVSAGSGQG